MLEGNDIAGVDYWVNHYVPDKFLYGIPKTAQSWIPYVPNWDIEQENPMNGYKLFECALLFVPAEGKPEYFTSHLIVARNADHAKTEALISWAETLADEKKDRDVEVLVRPF